MVTSDALPEITEVKGGAVLNSARVEYWLYWMPCAGVRYYAYENQRTPVDNPEHSQVFAPEGHQHPAHGL